MRCDSAGINYETRTRAARTRDGSLRTGETCLSRGEDRCPIDRDKANTAVRNCECNIINYRPINGTCLAVLMGGKRLFLSWKATGGMLIGVSQEIEFSKASVEEFHNFGLINCLL